MKPIPPPDSHLVLAAQGWFELGNSAEALKELEQVQPQNANHPMVAEVRWQIHAAAGKWADCVDVCQKVVETAPEESFGWVNRAYAIRRAPGGSVQAAYDALVPSVERVQDAGMVVFNLACYCCQLGRLPEAKNWLKKAFKVGPADQVKRMALAEPDLEPLWAEIREMGVV